MDPDAMLPTIKPTRQRPVGVVCYAVLLLTTCAGCMQEWSRRQEFGQPLQANVSKDLVISRINENVLLVHNWESDTVKVTSPTFVGSLKAHLSVQTARNFRLRATSIMGDEADFGSNDERFWFWMKRGDPHVITVRHDEMAQAQQVLPLPFQPDWLMQVLGVIPLDAAQYTLLPPAADGSSTLRADSLSPEGRPVVRIVRVNAYGLVLEHSLFDETGALVARAMLSDHRRHRESHAILPHRIDLNWQRVGLAMTLDIGEINVNGISASQTHLWQVPTIKGYPELDLGRQAAQGAAGRAVVPAAGMAPPAGVQFAQRHEPPWEQMADAAAVPVQAPPARTNDEPPWASSETAAEPVQWRATSFSATPQPPPF